MTAAAIPQKRTLHDPRGACIAAWFEMAGDTRCLLVLPLFHVNGIMASIVSPLRCRGS